MKRLKPKHFRSWSRPIWVSVSRNWWDCDKFIQKFIYLKFCIKIVGLNRSYSANTTNLKTTISQGSLKNLGLDQLLKCLGFRLSFFLYSPWGAYHWNIYLILKGCLILTKIIDCFWTKKCASHFFRELQKWKWLVLQ